MPNYVEYIKAGSGESWAVRDVDAQNRISTMNQTVSEMSTKMGEMETAIEEFEKEFENLDQDHPYLPLAGGTLTGPLILTSDVHYGIELPPAGVVGRIFFKKVSS